VALFGAEDLLLLTDGEVSRLISVAVQRLGVTEVRFIGGEPLLRRGLTGLVAAAAALELRPEISFTTNGIGLAGALAAAGLDRLNVSLDTLSRETFKESPAVTGCPTSRRAWPPPGWPR
jgi:cyclic pyranopterin phosphate synthase